MAKKRTKDTVIETYTHDDSKRKKIPTEQMQPFVNDSVARSIFVSYEKRNPDLDPQLIWRGKYDDDSNLLIETKPLYIQEKIHPKAIIENLRKKTKEDQGEEIGQFSLFDDTWGVDTETDKMAFYQHDENWTNRMILGDSLLVMSSLANREGLRGKVQCVYMDPPYGIKFNSNFQWSTTNKEVKDGRLDNMTREPEMVKAFRDTWKDGVNSYLSYLRDRLLVVRDLLTDSGSVFVQIGDENLHLVRAVMDEVFGKDNFIAVLVYRTKSMPLGEKFIWTMCDYILWYGKNREATKFNRLYRERKSGEDSLYDCVDELRGETNKFTSLNLTSSGRTDSCVFDVSFNGKKFKPASGKSWRTNQTGMERLKKAGRLYATKSALRYKLFFNDYPVQELGNIWADVQGDTDKVYVVQTAKEVISRCVLMTTSPGDLVLDPTCGSGTTAFVSEHWGRRWITIDTSRVALALARSRLMGGKFPYFIKKDSREGQIKEAELNNKPVNLSVTSGSLTMGFVYKRVPHITLKSIAQSENIDVIYDKWESKLEQALSDLKQSLNLELDHWEVPSKINEDWTQSQKTSFNSYWDTRKQYQQEIDASIVFNAEFENLLDKPYEDSTIIRVTGPFTFESLSPHRILSVDANGNQIDPTSTEVGGDGKDFVAMILENLRKNGIQQTHREGELLFTCVEEWPGNRICAVGKYLEGEVEKRVAILVGPEFGTLSRPDIMEAAREAAESGCDMLVACAFHFDAQSTEVVKLGKLTIMKVMMNTDLMMGDALKGKGNLFVAFGEPDIVVEEVDSENIRVRVRGIDVFFPNTGEVRSDNEDGIACWFVDTDYDQESFFVRQAYFLGAKDPYGALKRTLKADINADVWNSLHSNVSRPFKKPENGQIAVKVINHLGDEVMKVLRV